MLQMDELISGHRKLGTAFADVTFYFAPVPTYTGGAMALGWASDDAALRRTPAQRIAGRMAAIDLRTNHYTAAIHVGAFAMPRNIAQALGVPA